MFLTIVISIITVIILVETLSKKYPKKKLNGENIKRIPDLNVNRKYSVSSITGHNQNSKKDEELGWELEENSHMKIDIKIPYVQGDMSVNYNLNDVGARSNVANTRQSNIKKYLGFFGCSISYGHGLDEKETFAYQLAKKKNFSYLNFAVPGYSSYQSLMRLKKNINKVKFETIVLGIHKDLERRNTCSISWSKVINNFWGIPSILCFNKMSIKTKPLYRLESKKNFTTLKFFFEVLNFIKFFFGSMKFIQKHTMKKILLDFKSVCKKNDIELVIICLENYKSIYEFLNKNKFNWVASELNLNEKNVEGEFMWQKMPWDNHPNEKANKIYAEKLSEFFETNQRPYNPVLRKKEMENDDQEYIYPLW